jgi:uncharacterized lipoprotein YbaY
VGSTLEFVGSGGSRMTFVYIVGAIELAQGPIVEGLDVRVRLEDTTMKDGPSVVMAETYLRLKPGAEGLARFRLAVRIGGLDSRSDYTLSARGRRPGAKDFQDFGTVQSYPWRLGVDRRYNLVMAPLREDRQN